MFDKKCINPACGEVNLISHRGSLMYCKVCGEKWDSATTNYDVVYSDHFKFLKFWCSEMFDDQIYDIVAQNLSKMQGLR